MLISGSYAYIPVSDLIRSRDWYSEHLGFRTFHEDPLFIGMRCGEMVRIMLITKESGINSHMEYSNGPQSSYGFIVSDIMGVRAELGSNGIDLGKISNYAGTSFSFRDPDDNVVELWGDYTGLK